MAASAAASVVWLTPEPIITLVSGLLSIFGAALPTAVLATAFVSFTTSFVALLAAGDSDFLFVTGAFDCTVANFSAAFDKDFSSGLAAALEIVLPAALAAAFGSGRETALDGILFVDFTPVAPAATFGRDACVLATASLAGFTAGLAALLAEEGFAVFAEDVGVFAGFFIAFAMESTTK